VRVEHEFGLMDKDGSGIIDMEELHAYLKEKEEDKAVRVEGRGEGRAVRVAASS
jgi:Ca2+-binding EF-hand superfamily protein